MKPGIVFLSFVTFSGTVNAQIFADFQTSAGNFTCELNHAAAPKAVANFIGLAEGSRPWVDPATGAVRGAEPYYNGSFFHRVKQGEFSQGGSRNGLGDDGPGYTFKDETGNGLTHVPYAISMANTGPNTHTNGAQFFIMDTAGPGFDRRYTVFGAVTTGQAVMDSINDMAVTANGQGEVSMPVNPITIHSVAIRRVGPAAAAFDIHAQGLAVVTGAMGNLDLSQPGKVNFTLASLQPAGSIFKVSRSQTLQSWESFGSLYRGTGTPGAQTIQIDTPTAAKAFYQLPLVIYPDALTPQATGNRTLDVRFSTNTLIFNFNAAANGGTGSLNGDDFIISSVTYSRGGPYAATWTVNTDELVPLRVRAILNRETSAVVEGTHQLDQSNGLFWVPVASGTMTLTK